jgi:hypothetical protein
MSPLQLSHCHLTQHQRNVHQSFSFSNLITVNFIKHFFTSSFYEVLTDDVNINKRKAFVNVGADINDTVTAEEETSYSYYTFWQYRNMKFGTQHLYPISKLYK